MALDILTLPQSSIYRYPFSGEGVWSRADFLSTNDVVMPIDLEVENELHSFYESKESLKQNNVTQKLLDFSWQVFNALFIGRGFLVIRSSRLVFEQRSINKLLKVSSLLGNLLPQDASNSKFFSVRDEGYGEKELAVVNGLRGAATRSTLALHTDSAPMFGGYTPDIVGLAVLQTSSYGGDTILMSSYTLHNVLLARYPDTLERLYKPFFFDRSAGVGEAEARLLFSPIFTCFNELQVRYNVHYIYKGHQLAKTPLSPIDSMHLDTVKKLLGADEFTFRLRLEKGDLLLLNNYTMLHGRTEFIDSDDELKKRHLVRLWITSKRDI